MGLLGRTRAGLQGVELLETACVAASLRPETGPAPALDKVADGLLGPALGLPGGRLSQALGRCGLAPGSRLGPSYNQLIPLGTFTRVSKAL